MSAVVHEPVLVLNKNWEPIDFHQVGVAITNVLRGMACVLDCDPDSPTRWVPLPWEEWVAEERQGTRAITTARGDLPAPEVVVLTQYKKLPPRRLSFTKPNLFRRDEHRCQYCGRRRDERLTVDHVVPRSRGGATSWENCVAACKHCNGQKADRTPTEAGLRLRSQPAKPAWKPGLKIPRGEVRASWEPFLRKRAAAS